MGGLGRVVERHAVLRGEVALSVLDFHAGDDGLPFVLREGFEGTTGLARRSVAEGLETLLNRRDREGVSRVEVDAVEDVRPSRDRFAGDGTLGFLRGELDGETVRTGLGFDFDLFDLLDVEGVVTLREQRHGEVHVREVCVEDVDNFVHLFLCFVC